MSTKNRHARKSGATNISKIGQRRQVVIPRAVCDDVGLEEGDFVEVTSSKGAVVIMPRRIVDPDDVLTPEEVKRVRKGEQQLRKGQSRSWKKIKDELGL